jgi:predicted nucleic acid-binding protein
VELIKTYSKSHNLNLPDALIAATAIIKQMPLITLNLKDFKYIDELEIITI